MAENVHGMRELQRKLRKLEDAVETKALRSAVRAAAQPVARTARVRVPKSDQAHLTYKKRVVAPGFASRNIRVVTFAKGTNATALVGVRKEAFYATQFVERGTVRSRRQKWLEPAYDSTKGQQEAAFVESLRKSIDRATKG